MTAARQPMRWDPDALARLEHERDVLLRELHEIDQQVATGELRQDQHTTLRDELTARAAEVLVHITRGRAARPAPSRRRPWVVALTAATLAGAAVLAGWLLVGQLAPRVPPAPPAAIDASSDDARAARLATVVRARPDDAPARMALARLLLQQQDLPGALEQFDAAARLDPGNAEALAYGGWVAELTGVSDGLTRLDRAVGADPTYPDAHALRGLVLMRGGDNDAAAGELRRYLELAPDGPLAAEVRGLIERLGGAP
jgi:cytochrome c-type biogenesis protein CcmH/NrfG